MRQNPLRLALDMLMMLTVCSLAATGLLLAFVLPPGSGSAAVWGMTRHDWGDVHLWIAGGMALMLAIHLVLNWSWVCTTAARLLWRGTGVPGKVRRGIAGVAMIALIAGAITAFLCMATSSIQRPEGGAGRRHNDADASAAEHAGVGRRRGWNR